jgi:hypothetical protein
MITSTTPTVCTVTGLPAANQASYTATIIAAGEAPTPALCKLTAQVAGNNAYASAKATATIAISKAGQNIAFTAPATLAYLQATSALPALSNAPASQPITYAVTGPCSLGAGNVVIANAGTGSCTIAATAPATPLYSAYSNASFATIPLQTASQTISAFTTVPAVPTFVAGGGGTFQVSATGGASGNPVTFAVPTTTSVCSVSSATVTMRSGGICTIVANQAGSANYAAATLTQSVQIARASQTITFANPGNKTLGTLPFALAATASSGLPVAFYASAGSCSVSGTPTATPCPNGAGGNVAAFTAASATLTSTGSCTITACQPGDTNFAAAAPNVGQTFLIDLANVWKPTTGKMTVPRSHHTATRLEAGPLAGKILIVGGLDATGSSTATSELYDPSTRKFTATTVNRPTTPRRCSRTARGWS